MRTTLFQGDDQKSLLLIVVHHIVADRASLRTLAEELARLYSATSRDCAPELPNLTIQYGDYAKWQRSVSEEEWEPYWFYWRHQLGGERGNLKLLQKCPRHAIQIYNAAAHTFLIPTGLVAAIRKLGLNKGAKEAEVCLALFHALLLIYSDEKDFSIGITVSGLISVNTLLLPRTRKADRQCEDYVEGHPEAGRSSAFSDLRPAACFLHPTKLGCTRRHNSKGDASYQPGDKAPVSTRHGRAGP